MAIKLIRKIKSFLGLTGVRKNFPAPLQTIYAIEEKEIVYLSKNKISTAISSFSKSFSPSISLSGSPSPLNPQISGSASLSSGTFQRNDRQLINEFLDFIQDNNRVAVESSPEKGKYFLITCRAACGTAWPWVGASDGMRNVAWWVGNNNSIRVMAFGSVNNVIGQGNISVDDIQGTSTWWPSKAEAYEDLLEHLGNYVISTSSNPNLGNYDLSDLYSEVFNTGVRRGNFIHSEGTYIILLRVDAVLTGNDIDFSTTVMGSPVFVLK